jgi:hypothetical protein
MAAISRLRKLNILYNMHYLLDAWLGGLTVSLWHAFHTGLRWSMNHFIGVMDWNRYVYAALTDGFSRFSYKLIRTDPVLDFVALPVMQRLRHNLFDKNRYCLCLKFSVMNLNSTSIQD